MKLHDASGERKSGDRLYELIKEVFQMLEKDWEVKIVALVTDAGGDCRKAKRLFLREFGWVAVLDCWAHQVSTIHVISRFVSCFSNLCSR